MHNILQRNRNTRTTWKFRSHEPSSGRNRYDEASFSHRAIALDSKIKILITPAAGLAASAMVHLRRQKKAR